MSDIPNDWDLLDELLAPLDERDRRMVKYIVSKLVGKTPDKKPSEVPAGAVALMAEAHVDTGPRRAAADVETATDPVVKKLLKQ